MPSYHIALTDKKTKQTSVLKIVNFKKEWYTIVGISHRASDMITLLGSLLLFEINTLV